MTTIVKVLILLASVGYLIWPVDFVPGVLLDDAVLIAVAIVAHLRLGKKNPPNIEERNDAG